MKTKKARTTFTTTLPIALLDELERAAQELHRKKNDIILEALTTWLEEYTQAQSIARKS